MTSRVLREIPLKILHRKIGDERVTLLQACYDNPIFNEDDTKGFPTQNGSNRTGKPTDYGVDVFEDGVDGRGSAYSAAKRSTSCHVANDYMHSLPPSRSMPNEITFRAHRKRSRLFILLLVCLVVVVAMTIGLLVYFLGARSSPSSSSSSSSSLSSTSSPVITIANIQGSLTIIAGPFAVYNPNMADSSSPAFILTRNAFVFKIDKVLMSSHFASLYNRTQLLYLSENQGHLQLSFLIYLQPDVTLPPDLVEHMKDVLIEGFKDSLFIMDNNSVTLVAKTSAPVTTPFPPGQCQPLSLHICINKTGYNSTVYPNLLGHKTSQEAEHAIQQEYTFLFMNSCYGHTTDFFCSVFAPECGQDEKPIPPCRKYCQDVMTNCKSTYSNESTTPVPVSCDDLPDSDNPKVCRQNPYQPGVCVAVDLPVCQIEGYNFSRAAFPNAIGSVAVGYDEKHDMNSSIVIQGAVHCFKHSMLFLCSLFAPPCSGQPFPNHMIPPCASLCQTYKDRCGIFRDIFHIKWPGNLNCSVLPDSPDPSVCVGYYEAREPAIRECQEGQVRCGNNQCIKTSWLCDGFQDCDDNSDEAHCATCAAGEQMCSPASSLCIPKSQGCDGANDCYMDVDEHFCVRMNTDVDEDVLEVYNSVTSEWEEVCREGWTAEFSDLACKQLGYKNALATYYAPEGSAKKSKVSALKNGSDEDRLQSYMDKGYQSCSTGYVVKLVCWETVCGIRPAYFRSATRVVGGDEVKPGAWPWMVSLHGGTGEKYFCGATIIHPQWLLTAGHCVGGADKDQTAWTIKAGSTRRVAYSEHRQVRKVKQLFNHPEFKLETVENDVALIHLERPLAMNDFVRPVCLPEQLPEVGTRCYATGWGKAVSRALKYEPAMRQVALDVSSWDYCKHAILHTAVTTGLQIPYKLTKTMFCAGGANSHDACQGDSGGPLVCRKENSTDEWYQGGVVSWGLVCGYPNTPGVYTNLPMYVDWINGIIANYSYSAPEF